jgi:hypothetical protein
MALATQARRRYVSDAFRGARIRKDLKRCGATEITPG